MTNTVIVGFVHTKHNNSSIATLCSILERKFPSIEVSFFKPGELDRLEKFRKELKILLCFSFTSAEIFKIKRMLGYVKRNRNVFNADILLIAGGPHASGDPEGTLKLGFDIVARGEGEKTLPELIQAIQDQKPLREVKGLAFYEQENVILTEPNEFIDINECSSIARRWNIYNHIEITRGCPFQCKYCQTSQLFGTKPRHKSIETIMKDIKFMKAREKTDFRFISPNAFGYGSPDGKTISLEAIESLLKSIREEIQNKGRIFFGTFPSEIRPEFVNEAVLEIVKKYVNNDNLIMGAQSGSRRILKEIGRGHDLDDIYQAVATCNAFTFRPIVDFIFGCPMETTEERLNSLEVFRDLHKRGARIRMHFFIPLPGTPFWKLENPVSFIEKDIERELNTMASRGILFGQWQSHIRISQKVLKYRRKILKLN
ncbi:MAG: TIGR04013 family B12-binding domain/radical SAM domain-containing protein [Candidatus Helarchaeales archaeon]